MYFYKLIQAKLYFPPARGHAELNLDKYLLRIALIFQVLYREGNLLELVLLDLNLNKTTLKPHSCYSNLPSSCHCQLKSYNFNRYIWSSFLISLPFYIYFFLKNIEDQAFQWIFCTRAINRPRKEVFSKIARAIYCLP